jgi:divalent metal cation (Fe/Co/Zn/Cd) transporter
MSSHAAPPLPRGGIAGDAQSRLAKRARLLSLLSIAWMTAEAGVAITAALIAGSVALLAFGLDSLVELASAGTILWLFSGRRAGSASAERRAQQLIAICFGALAIYVSVYAIEKLVSGSQPQTSWPGLGVAAAAILVMPLLARAKRRVAVETGSAAVAGDAAQSWLCALGAAAAVSAVLANAALGWWWLDPVAGLGIAVLAVREGREAWLGELCEDCAPGLPVTRRERRGSHR